MTPGPTRPVLVVLRALGLGDLLAAVPALRALADAFPDHHRVLATPEALHPLAAHLGVVDELVAARPLEPLPETLRRPAVAVNLHGSGPQSHRVLLALEPERLVAFACGDIPGPTWRDHEHERVRWCRLLQEEGIAADPGRLDLDPPDRPVPAAAVGATLVHPFAASRARRWPLERWAAVVRSELAAGRQIVVTGSAAERDDALALARMAGLPERAVLAGTVDVLGLAALVAAADRVVCPDTGVAHVATALGTPSVVLFGPVPPDEWGPPPDRPRHIALWAGRRGSPHGDVVDPGLLELTVDDVLAALAQLPGRYAGATP